ncbi:MAG TPA: carbon starvation protein A [Candidatus Krumholzibacteria bacterium]|nr:carbon starvation protein A [Candidatus Krumholzibacteria bacterium]
MSTLLVGAALAVWLTVGYRWYGRLTARRLFRPDDANPVPSRLKADGRDYHAARAPVLFGHHFSSIAGAGPIVGPLIGVTHFGWGPSLLWIALGSVFLGAVHDYTALMASVRSGGCSIGEIAERSLGRRARVVLSLFLWAALVLVVAVFGVITAKTFVARPGIVLPTFGLIGVAMVFGAGVLRRGGRLLPGTLAALGALAALIWLGERFPLAVGDTVLGLPAVTFWFWTLMAYCVLASVLPVWLLLQPRDYLSTWILYLGLGGGVLGLLAAHPAIHAPAFVTGLSPTQGPVWPMLFVMIACGAISGFHSLVGGGTTSKQLARETDGLRVGYGAMILEAGLAGLVVLIAAGALPWDAAASPAAGSLQHLMGPGGGPILAFATGFGTLVDALPGLTAPMGLFFGVLMINAFVVTTLDTSTRLGRFVLEELGAGVPGLGNRWGATLLTVGAAGWLGASGGYDRIWPVFGATNQLVAALSLLVVSAWLVGLKKPRALTLVPSLLMLATTVAALLWQVRGFLRDGQPLLAGAGISLVLLALFLAWEARGLLRRAGGRERE